jgi:eukaryotic-like serine/threonine-protein kinase
VQPQTTGRVVGGRYRLGGVLGEGGMAKVYDAYDERLERPVAVKILHRTTEVLPGMRRRFEQEARIAARLIHPHIVAVLDYGEDDDACYLVMERLPGTTLREEIAWGPVPVRRIVLVIMETLTALEAAHRYGVLHRDVKPSNILHQDDGHTKIADFGIAKSLDLWTLTDQVPDDMTQTGIVLGTPGYLAPERRRGEQATVRSDLYGVGAAMVEAVTGTRPGLDHIEVAAVPSPLRAVATRAVAPDPEQRFASAAEMLQALTSLQRDRPPVPLVLASGAPATQLLPPTTALRPEDLPSRTTALAAPPLPRRAAPARRDRRRPLAGLALGGLVLAAALGLAAMHLSSDGAGPAHGVTPPTHPRGAQTASHLSDPVGSELRSAARIVGAGSMPGDILLEQTLDQTAAQPPGIHRAAVAQQAIVVAQVLSDAGAITPGEYQDATQALSAAGASPVAIPLAPPSQTTTTSPGPGPPPGHGHDHGGVGDGSGQQD